MNFLLYFNSGTIIIHTNIEFYFSENTDDARCTTYNRTPTSTDYPNTKHQSSLHQDYQQNLRSSTRNKFSQIPH